MRRQTRNHRILDNSRWTSSSHDRLCWRPLASFPPRGSVSHRLVSAPPLQTVDRGALTGYFPPTAKKKREGAASKLRSSYQLSIDSRLAQADAADAAKETCTWRSIETPEIRLDNYELRRPRTALPREETKVRNSSHGFSLANMKLLLRSPLRQSHELTSFNNIFVKKIFILNFQHCHHCYSFSYCYSYQYILAV